MAILTGLLIFRTIGPFRNSAGISFPSEAPTSAKIPRFLQPSNNNGGSSVQHHLNTVQANAEYHFGDRVSAVFGWFNVDGTPDPVVYGQAPVYGSANGDPRSSGYIGNLSWWPVQNISLTFQYTGYTRFNGAATNYDGAGRDAGSNNTMYLLARFVF